MFFMPSGSGGYYIVYIVNLPDLIQQLNEIVEKQ